MDADYKSLNVYIKSVKDLKDTLEGYGIDTYLWNKKAYKSVETLFEEVRATKSEILIKEQSLIRRSSIVGVYVYYKIQHLNGESTILRLRETMELERDDSGHFSSKDIVKRTYPTSVGKKLGLNEYVADAAMQALKTRLGFETFNKNSLKNLRKHERLQESSSYPGLKTLYIFHEFDIFIDSIQFLPSGYCFEKKGKLFIYEWVIS